jgi:hypothetical protein
MDPKKHEKKSQVHICVKQTLQLTKMPESCVSVCMEYGMKKQTVRPPQISSFDREGLPIMQKAAQGNTHSHQNK